MKPVGHLARADIHYAFRLLGDRLAQRGVVADMYVAGDAAMVLSYDSRRATRDIVAFFEPHAVVAEEAAHIARDHGLPQDWLNHRAGVHDELSRDLSAPWIFDHPGLRVAVASAAHLLAQKVLTGDPREFGDLGVLIALLELRSVGEILAVCHDIFPDEMVPVRARLLLEDLMEHA